MVSTRLYRTRMCVVAGVVLVASHERIVDREQVCYDCQHYIPLVRRKPGALRNGAPFTDMAAPLLRLRHDLMRRAGGDRLMAQVLAAVPGAGLPAVLEAVEFVVASGVLSAEHVANVPACLGSAPPPERVGTSRALKEAPVATPTATTAGARSSTAWWRQAMHDITDELKDLRLHGMAGAWADLMAQGEARWRHRHG